MSPYISDDAFLPKSVNNKQKTVTLPLEEYEALINAQKVADTEMRKAKSILEKNQIEIIIRRDDYTGMLLTHGLGVVAREVMPREELWLFNSDDEVKKKLKDILEFATDHIQDRCDLKIGECNTKIEQCKRLVERVGAYNARGAMHRFFNEFRP